MKDFLAGLLTVSVIGAVIVFVLGLALWGCPKWNLYAKDLSGQAQLKEQEWTKKILIEEARAKQESAVLLARAEVERASGVAAANKIIGQSLEGNESYLRYLWIQGLQDGSSEVIYVPTEANLPILEARDNPPGFDRR